MNIPDAPLNGGLYTGEPFAKGAPWANVPLIPDTDYMIGIGLKSANPPPGALVQYPGYTRQGNNYQALPGVKVSKGIACNNASCGTCWNPDQPMRFSKYAYLP